MRLAWNILSIVALANLLAVAALVAWLVGSNRLNAERMHELRVRLAETVPDEVARKQAEEAARLAEEAAARVEPTGVAVSANELLQVRLEISEIDRQRTELMRQQIRDMQAVLAKDRADLEAQWAALRREREAFRSEVSRLAEIDGGRQFRKAVKVLEGLRPEVASGLLAELIAKGPALVPDLAIDADAAGLAAQNPREEGMIRAVSYLNAMQERSRNRIMELIGRDQPALAAELLERLRMRGMWAGVRETD
ncbi:MAG: hypothetical protein KF866_02270 [Phycisphaeraceae bacterium]|nr:hypothetical protein [Phycisphaeraceae bacterium]MCW5753481.1 hypothetical protein [Phycisphaeraceae bacterium]